MTTLSKFSIQAINKFYDNEYGGVTELTDRYWNPHSAGTGRTLHLQLDAARVLALYAYQFCDSATLYNVHRFMEILRALMAEERLAAIYSADWQTPLDYEVGLALEISATNFIATLKKLGINIRYDGLCSLTESIPPPNSSIPEQFR